MRSRGRLIAFCHPDLGLGGAERLVVDAAVELARRPRTTVHVFTAHHDPTRCFQETLTGAFPVYVHGDWFPRHILGKAHALCAYIRCIFVALAMAFICLKRRRKFDIVLVDQVSVTIPILKLFAAKKILFYCHFPDLLLAQKSSLIRRVYRGPIDYVEQMTTGAADRILVNSLYTKAVFALTFRRLNSRGIIPSVLYPAVHIPSDADIAKANKAVLDHHRGKAGVKLPLDSHQEQQHLMLAFMTEALTFLSINRYERKKNITLAIQALAKLHKSRGSSSGVVESASTPSKYKTVRLVVAGGYDGRVKENVEHAAELEQLAEKLGVGDSILFIKSFTDNQRSLMLAASVAVLYTPENEHFGIVPLEAGAAGKAVVACDSGGPLESVVDKKTGFLVESKAEKWCGAMRELLKEGVAEEMGKAGRERVKRQFSRRAFGKELNGYCEELVTQ